MTLLLLFSQNSLEISQGYSPFASPLRTSSSSTQPILSPREVDMAGMTLQTSEGHPGLGTDVFVPQSLQWDEEGSMAGRSVCESEQIQVLETPHLTSLLPVAPDGSQVCLYSWGEGL